MNSPTAETSTALPHGIECDLAIVGAGPAGSAAAYHAARAGLEVVLVDMADEVVVSILLHEMERPGSAPTP